MNRALLCFLAGCFVVHHLSPLLAAPRDLIGHWPLGQDGRDTSGHARHAANQGVEWTGGAHAAFNGRTGFLEVPVARAPRLGTNDFTMVLWVDTDATMDDSLGDLLSQFDPEGRRGFNLTIQHQSGACTSTANTRNLFFGIDAGTTPRWEDCGRPGNNRMVYALTVFRGELYAGTFEYEADEAGRVYRYMGGKRWEDCGAPDPCNTVSALAVHEGELYAGVSHYSGVGSHLPPSPNTHPGGRVYRYAGDRKWIDCGQVGPGGVIWGMTVFQGKLHVTSVDLPPKHMTTPRQGLYRHEGGTNWVWCGNPGGRVVALTPANGELYASGFNGGSMGGVFRYDGGTNWTNFGAPPNVDQTYSFAFHRGIMHTGTWKEGKVYRYLGPNRWEDSGRLGQELEVMGMALYNGKLYGGTLPLAEVYRHDADVWTLTGRLDFSEVEYRRAWSMAVYQGRLFCGTLPSGHVHALQAGRAVSHDVALPPGWRHLVAMRDGRRLKLFVDGQRVAISEEFEPAAFDLSVTAPLRIGFGEHDHFNGRMRDVRLLGRAFSDREVRRLFRQSKR